MRPITKNNAFFFVLFLMLYTCTKENEETNLNPELKTEKLDTKKAAAEWRKFNATTAYLSAITVTHLKSLLNKINASDNIKKKDSLTEIYRQSENEFNGLQSHLEEANTAFQKDLVVYNRQKEIKYRAFKNLFFHDIMELNNNLEELLEENVPN